MNKIRKIWIGQTIKGQDTMSWELGQRIRLNKEATEFGVIDSINKNEEGYDINVKQGKLIRTWKKALNVAAIEYDLEF